MSGPNGSGPNGEKNVSDVLINSDIERYGTYFHICIPMPNPSLEYIF